MIVFRLALSLFLLALGSGVLARPSEIHVMRHLNTPAGERDPDLTAQGADAAVRLDRWFIGKPVKAIYVSDFRRTRQTVGPLARRLGIVPRLYDPADTTGLVARIDAETGPVLIVGHSNTVPAIIAALGGTAPPPLDHDDFGDVWTVSHGTTRHVDLARASEQDALIAIDILLLPDDAMIARSRAINHRLRVRYPAGYALDAAHRPHVTLVQRYVRSSDLPALFAALDRLSAARPVKPLRLRATSLVAGTADALGIVMVGLDRTPPLLTLKDAVVETVRPFSAEGGTAAAFVADPGGPIARQTIDWVETFVPKASGEAYFPHITVGVAALDDARDVAAGPFAPLEFDAPTLAVYRLGNFGTAQQRLWSADLR